MAEKTYKVVGAHSYDGHEPGSTFKAKTVPNEALLVDGGTLAIVKAEKLICSACVEQGVKKPPKFDSPAERDEHYAEKHPGLVAPGEEE